jgi:hypothetical protein
VFRHIVVHHSFDRQAHGTIFSAGVAVDALFCFGFKEQRGPLESISYCSADNHKWSHPAQMVAEGSSPKEKTWKHDE